MMPVALFDPFSVPIVALVLVFGTGIVKTIVSALERRHELIIQSKQAQQESKDAELKALRDELSAFKDTSTKYDLSLDQLLQRMEHRMDRMEQLINPSGAASPKSETPSSSPETYSPKISAPETPNVQVIGRIDP